MSAERITELRNRARRARELSFAQTDKQVVANLNSYAGELEAEVSKLEAPTLPSAAVESLAAEASTGLGAIADMKPAVDAEPDKSDG